MSSFPLAKRCQDTIISIIFKLIFSAVICLHYSHRRYEELATVRSAGRCGDGDFAYNEQLLQVSSCSSVKQSDRLLLFEGDG